MNISKTLPTNDHLISLQSASEMTARYRENREMILTPDQRGKNILAENETFNREAIEKLLVEKDCAGVRIYYGMDLSLKCHAILVGVNSLNEDILPGSSEMLAASDEVILEEGQRCPDICPPDSPLNK